jgi:hypothetical protein
MDVEPAAEEVTAPAEEVASPALCPSTCTSLAILGAELQGAYGVPWCLSCRFLRRPRSSIWKSKSMWHSQRFPSVRASRLPSSSSSSLNLQTITSAQLLTILRPCFASRT